MFLSTFGRCLSGRDAYQHIVVVAVVTTLFGFGTGLQQVHAEVAIAFATPSPVDVYQSAGIDAVEDEGMAC